MRGFLRGPLVADVSFVYMSVPLIELSTVHSKRKLKDPKIAKRIRARVSNAQTLRGSRLWFRDEQCDPRRGKHGAFRFVNSVERNSYH